MEQVLIAILSGFLGGLLGAFFMFHIALKKVATKDDVKKLRETSLELVEEVKESRKPIQIG